jgi:hypothetical protein
MEGAMAIWKDTADQLLDCRDPKQGFNKDGLFDELKKAPAERVLNAQIDDHLMARPPKAGETIETAVCARR